MREKNIASNGATEDIDSAYCCFDVLFILSEREEMYMQIQFSLPEIDRKATRESVESLLEKYRMYLLQTSLDRLPSITASYSLVLNSPGGLPSSSTESSAVANVDYDRERKRFIGWIVQAVNRLPHDERSIIVQRYMRDDEMFDYQTYGALNMSERNYFRLKSRAFYKLAFALKVEFYKEEVKEIESSTTNS